jgi:type IV secretion system protein VirD4
MKNYAGHRLSPWLGHLMVSRQETARPLLTPGEVMQLPQSDELVLVSGLPPIRAKKARYYEDRRFTARVLTHSPSGHSNGMGWALQSSIRAPGRSLEVPSPASTSEGGDVGSRLIPPFSGSLLSP